MKILVTGSEGFIGKHLVRHLREKHTVVEFDKRNGAEEDLYFGFPWIDDDVEAVIHLAAETFVDTSIANPRTVLNDNIIGTFELLEALRDSKVERYIQISTDEVYGAMDYPALETDRLNPGNPYSASKAAADMLALSYHNTYKIPLIIARPENNYGSGQGWEKFIPTVIRHALKGTPIPIYGDGRHKRMWLHVKDTCRAIETLLEKGGNGHIYNIGGSEEWQNINIAKFILEEMLVKQNFNFIPDEVARPGHDRAYNINTNKIRELGWKPQHRIVTELPKIIESYTQRS